MGFGQAMGAAVSGWNSSADDRKEKAKKKEDKLATALKKNYDLYGSNTKDTGVATGAYTGNTAEEVTNKTTTPEDVNYATALGIDKTVLDAVAVNEGTSETGYNTEYAYGKYSGGRTKKFRDMTVNEVYKHQEGMRDKQKGNKLISSAAGRYQMLQATLKEEMGKAGLDPTKEKFTPELQDKLILQRLKRMRGYKDWKDGKINDDDFKANLSKEFASVMNPYTGKGHYKGQGAKPINFKNVEPKTTVSSNSDYSSPAHTWSKKKMDSYWKAYDAGETV